MRELSKAQGLTGLYNQAGQLIQAPHVQLAGLSTVALTTGTFPADGDDSWWTNLEASIRRARDGGNVRGPPVPAARPPIDTSLGAPVEPC